MSFDRTISAILRGYWLIERNFANAQLPLVMRMISGENISLGDARMMDDETEQNKSPKAIDYFSENKNAYLVSPRTELSMLPSGSIAVVNIAGPLLKSGGYCSYGMTDIAQLISRLGAEGKVDGILLNIDSPGGQAYGTSLLADVIKSVDKVKPILSVTDDGMAASAAMWITSAARESYATKKTDKFGSVGVYTTIADFNKHYAEYFKLPVFDIYAPQSTEKNASYTEALNGNEEALKNDLSVLAQQFIDTIKQNRGDRIKGDSWTKGKMFYANEAVKIGLIDGVKSFEKVIDRINQLVSETKTPIKKTRNMAFEKTIETAKAQSFEVVEGGFLLTEDHLNNIESRIIELENNVVEKGELQQAKAKIEEKEKLIVQKDNRINELENEVKELGGTSSGEGTVAPIAGDLPIEIKKVASYNDPNSEINKIADRRIARNKANA